MRRAFLQIIVILTCFVSITVLNGQEKYSNEFLSIGVGARALAMGGAVSASTGDATSFFWNPAGLTRLDPNLQIGAMHTSWFSGVGNYNYLGLAKRLNNNDAVLSLGYIRFGIEGIPNTLELIDENGEIIYENIKEFNAIDQAIFGSYARALKNNKYRLGGSIKLVRRNLGTFANSIGFGIDLGIQYAGDKFFWGIMGKDLTTTFNIWNTNFTEKEKEILEATGNSVVVKGTELTNPTLILGGGYQAKIGEKSGLLLELNLDVTTDGKRNVLISSDPISINPHIGAEYRYKQFLFLRGGLNNFQKVIDVVTNESVWQIQPNIGLGVDVGPVRIDYALSNIGNVSDTRLSHVFTLFLDFNPKKVTDK